MRAIGIVLGLSLAASSALVFPAFPAPSQWMPLITGLSGIAMAGLMALDPFYD